MAQDAASPSRLLKVGDAAPEFSLKTERGQSVRLSEFRGDKNVVLIFYPADRTPGCTKQLCAVRDDFELFQSKDTVVFGINPQSAESHQKFVDKYDFPFPLLVDQDRNTCSAYGCKGGLSTKRTVYGIDKNGQIVFAARGKPSNEEILSAFD